MRKYNWGILSTANIGRKAMIPALKASRFAQVTAVASRDSQSAHNFARELGIPKSYGNYQALLDGIRKHPWLISRRIFRLSKIGICHETSFPKNSNVRIMYKRGKIGKLKKPKRETDLSEPI